MAFFLSCWSVNLICAIHALRICRMFVNVTYCDLWINNLRSLDVGMICDVIGVVCHGEVCGCILCELREIIVNCSYGSCIYPCCNPEWPLCELQWLKLWCLLKWDCDLEQLCLSLSPFWCLELDLVQWPLCDLWCVARVPEGGILCGQFMTMWSYSLHS